jgi:hypothetical protein
MRAGLKRLTFLLVSCAMLGPAARPPSVVAQSRQTAGPAIRVLSMHERDLLFNRWLKDRFERVLPEIMRREQIDMWIVICREHNEDPVYTTLVPHPSMFAWRQTVFVYFDRGAAGVERLTVNRYGGGDLHKDFPDYYQAAWEPETIDSWQRLAQIVKARNPKRIAVNESETWAFADGLSAANKRLLVRALGPDYAPRLVSAERLVVGWLERRSQAEIDFYPRIVAINHQEAAYVLREGEANAPKGLRDALARGNRLQDVLVSEMKAGKTGNEILASALSKARAEGLVPAIYSHPIGYHGHAAGTRIGLPDMQGGVPGMGDYPLFPDTCWAIELGVRVAIPEWDNQPVQMALEQDAVFTAKGTSFLDGRQTAIHLIR